MIKKIITKIKEGYLREMWDAWKWIAGYFGSYWKSIAFFLLSGILSIALSLASAVAGKYLIDAVTGHKTDKIFVCAALTIGLAIASALIMNGINLIKVKIRTAVGNEIQDKIYSEVLDSEWMEISRFRNGDILNRLNYDSAALTSSILEFIPNLINNLITFIGALCIMLYYDWAMALIALLSAPIATLLSYNVVHKIQTYSKAMLKTESDKMSFAEDSVSNIQTIKAFGIMDQFRRKMRDYLERCRDITVKNSAFMVKCQNILAMIGIIATYGCYCWGVYRLWGGFITYGTMTLFIDLAGRVRNGFSSLVNIVPQMITTSTRATRLMELEGLLKEESIPEHREKAVTEVSNIERIKVENVSFAYVEGHPVLKNISFGAEKGEVIALIGPSGEGKTTMARLLLGMIHQKEDSAQTDGEAYVETKDGIRIPLGLDTRQLFSYVPQGNTLFAGTIADNLRMAKEDATTQEMTEALKTADAWDFVEKLDGQLDYVIGEHGKGLSEGQAQRISIARALIRKTPIVLMDEATSALDTHTEKRILERIMQKDQEKIIIVTAHRRSVIEQCSRVYQVSEGRVEEIDKMDIFS